MKRLLAEVLRLNESSAHFAEQLDVATEILAAGTLGPSRLRRRRRTARSRLDELAAPWRTGGRSPFGASLSRSGGVTRAPRGPIGEGLQS